MVDVQSGGGEKVTVYAASSAQLCLPTHRQLMTQEDLPDLSLHATVAFPNKKPVIFA